MENKEDFLQARKDSIAHQRYAKSHSNNAGYNYKSILQVLPKARLIDLGRDFNVAVPTSATKDKQADALLNTGLVDLPGLLSLLGRDELKAVLPCTCPRR